jgi:hypothetical protein
MATEQTLGCNEPGGTAFPGLIVLGVGRGDGGHRATKGCQELEGKVPTPMTAVRIQGLTPNASTSTADSEFMTATF